MSPGDKSKFLKILSTHLFFRDWTNTYLSRVLQMTAVLGFEVFEPGIFSAVAIKARIFGETKPCARIDERNGRRRTTKTFAPMILAAVGSGSPEVRASSHHRRLSKSPVTSFARVWKRY